MADLLLDTTVLINALRGREAANRLTAGMRTGQRPPYVCAINAEELWRGTRETEARSVASLLRSLRTAPLGLAEGERAGRWRAQFAAKGVTLSQADCLIAAAALGVGAQLATGNPKHFPMTELDVAHWPAG